jgi:hypothetical protein
MTINDLLQAQSSLGTYGTMNPFTAPYGSLQQTAFNPQAAINPAAFNPPVGVAQTGVPNYSAIAQQQQLQQLAAILAAQGAIPQVFGGSAQNNPWQNPLVNPILAQQLAQQAASAYGQPPYAQIGPAFGQQNNLPFAQMPFAQTGYQLAPQSWVGQAGPFGGQPIPGQIHPHQLQHLLAARALY